MDEFPEQVPSTTDFQLGYFAGKQSAKYWLMCQADFHSMYKTVTNPGGKDCEVSRNYREASTRGNFS